MSVLDAVIEHRIMNLPDFVAISSKIEGCLRIFSKTIGFEEGMIMAKVASGWRRTGAFSPGSVGSFHFMRVKSGRDFSQAALAGLEDFCGC